MNTFLSRKIFDSRIRSDSIEAKEKWLGYFIGPVSVILMNSILSNYLNVYYTDVLNISHIWGGAFISLFPLVAKTLDALTFVYMGMVVDKTHTKQGKARPWILFSAPLLTLSMILLFVVPTGNDNLTAIWIFLSYTLFYSVAYTMYGTAHTLMVPLSTHKEEERSKLSLIANTPNMVAGSLIAVLFPTIVIPLIGVNRNLWMYIMLGVAIAAFPLILLEYFFTRERVTEQAVQASESTKHSGNKQSLSLKEQLSCCIKSRQWGILMVYLILIQTVNSMFSASTFYYCNWILGSYNDGYTQALFYALGQFPLGIGLAFCGPICKKFGKENAMGGGFLLSFLGVLICYFNPRNLILVLAGQIIRTIGLVPSSFMISGLLGDALDDVERINGKRCDGFSSSILNCITTLTSGIALCIFNFGIAKLGYQAPTDTFIPTQNMAVQNFIIFCVMGIQVIIYPIIAFLLSRKNH